MFKTNKLSAAITALLAIAVLMAFWLVGSAYTAEAQDLPPAIDRSAIYYVCPDGTIVTYGSREFCHDDDGYYYEVNYETNQPYVVYYPVPEPENPNDPVPTPQPPTAPRIRSNTFVDCEVENPPSNCNPDYVAPTGTHPDVDDDEWVILDNGWIRRKAFSDGNGGTTYRCYFNGSDGSLINMGECD